MAVYKSKLGKPDSKGNYKRDLGKKVDGKQHRFYLGKDAEQAEQRMLRLESLWASIESQAERPESAFWTDPTIQIGTAIGRGENSVRLAPPLPLFDDEDYRAYVHHVDLVARRFPMISILPAEVDGYKRGQEIILGIKREIAQIGQKAFGEPNILEMETAKLHDAMDAYIEAMKLEHVDPETRKLTAYGNNSVRQIELLKKRHENVMLGQLTLGTIKQAFQYWASRPKKKGTERPITVRSAENYIKRWRHFLWWVHDSDRFRWKAPSDLLRLKVKVRKTDKETQATISPIQIKAFKEDELVVLFKYATPLERVYILLGLNCGFAVSEFGTLRLNQIFLHQLHGFDKLINYQSNQEQSWIKRVRLKSKVYGEWLLWPQTVEAIKWAIERRKKQPEFRPDALLSLTERNLPYYGQTDGGNNASRISKLWYQGLLERISKDNRKFPRLSPKSLRKTAGNIMRDIAGGEIMGVFLAHGQPVRTDDLAEQYSNRPFGKLFEHLETMHRRLQPVWDAVPNPFPLDKAKTRNGGPNISVGTIDSIKELTAQGQKPEEIAKALNISVATVYRRRR